jgi:hypothetical protein
MLLEDGYMVTRGLLHTGRSDESDLAAVAGLAISSRGTASVRQPEFSRRGNL